MDFGVRRANHQPFKARLVYQHFQQTFPDTFVPPAAKPTVRIFPATIDWRQISPRCPRPQNPKYRIYKLAVVARIPAPSPLSPEQMRL
jgi:hypothetical protein